MPSRAPAPLPAARGAILAEALEVQRHINRSAHTDVYEVADRALDGAPFVAKVLRPDLAHSAPFVNRLRGEGQLLQTVDHPSVIRFVRALANPAGNVLELIAGNNLVGHLRSRRTLRWAEVASLGVAMGSALAAVHAAGLIHCDVKPTNILVTSRRWVLVDFDLARPPGPDSGKLGTPQWSAPEQVRGGDLGPAVDSWGLGMTLYFAATGRRAFDKADGFPQCELPPRPVEDRRLGGGEIAAVIDALLAVEPERRLPVADAVKILAPLR